MKSRLKEKKPTKDIVGTNENILIMDCVSDYTSALLLNFLSESLITCRRNVLVLRKYMLTYFGMKLSVSIINSKWFSQK